MYLVLEKEYRPTTSAWQGASSLERKEHLQHCVKHDDVFFLAIDYCIGIIIISYIDCGSQLASNFVEYAATGFGVRS